uniref:hypothetical protein n=1 Tax=Segatella hominis TaxID=2518605 RepID=UPI004027F816
MNDENKKVNIALCVCCDVNKYYCYGKSCPPPSAKGIHNGNKQTIFSNVYILGEYNKNSCIVELTFKQDIDNVEVIIYKGDSVCEYDQEQNIKKEDFYNYLLAQYGAGQYTICVKVDGITVVEKTVTCK